MNFLMLLSIFLEIFLFKIIDLIGRFRFGYLKGI